MIRKIKLEIGIDVPYGTKIQISKSKTIPLTTKSLKEILKRWLKVDCHNITVLAKDIDIVEVIYVK